MGEGKKKGNPSDLALTQSIIDASRRSRRGKEKKVNHACISSLFILRVLMQRGSERKEERGAERKRHQLHSSFPRPKKKRKEGWIFCLALTRGEGREREERKERPWSRTWTSVPTCSPWVEFFMELRTEKKETKKEPGPVIPVSSHDTIEKKKKETRLLLKFSLDL